MTFVFLRWIIGAFRSKFIKILKLPTVLVSELVSFVDNSKVAKKRNILLTYKKYGGTFHYPLLPQYYEK